MAEGSAASYTLALMDNELPAVTVSTPDATASEAGGGTNTASFVVTRANTTTGDLTVYYDLSGTANNGADYQFLNGTIVLPGGVASVTNIVTAIDDAVREKSGNAEDHPVAARYIQSGHNNHRQPHDQ